MVAEELAAEEAVEAEPPDGLREFSCELGKGGEATARGTNGNVPEVVGVRPPPNNCNKSDKNFHKTNAKQHF